MKKNLCILVSVLSIGLVIFYNFKVNASEVPIKKLWKNNQHKICSSVEAVWNNSNCATVVNNIISQNINTIGNTSGNLCNYGYYAAQGNWIYYRNFNDNDKLYKMKLDGTNNIKLCNDRAYSINVVGDFIYYLTSVENSNSYIKKIKIDGSNESIMMSSSNPITFLNVCGDNIYYIMMNIINVNQWYYSINEMKTDGTNLREIFSVHNKTASYLSVSQNYAYMMVNDAKLGNSIYKISLDKYHKVVKLTDRAVTFNVSGNWIYYGTFKEIRKVRIDGTEDQKIIDGFPGGLPNGQWGDPCCLNVEGNWIYYKDWNEQIIYKVDINGNSKMKLADCTASSLNFAGGYLYCPEYKFDEKTDISKYVQVRKIKVN